MFPFTIVARFRKIGRQESDSFVVMSRKVYKQKIAAAKLRPLVIHIAGSNRSGTKFSLWFTEQSLNKHKNMGRVSGDIIVSVSDEALATYRLDPNVA